MNLRIKSMLISEKDIINSNFLQSNQEEELIQLVIEVSLIKMEKTIKVGNIE